MSRATKMYKCVSEVKLKAKALQPFKVSPVLKIDPTFLNCLDLCDSETWKYRLALAGQI